MTRLNIFVAAVLLGAALAAASRALYAQTGPALPGSAPAGKNGDACIPVIDSGAAGPHITFQCTVAPAAGPSSPGGKVNITVQMPVNPWFGWASLLSAAALAILGAGVAVRWEHLFGPHKQPQPEQMRAYVVPQAMLIDYSAEPDMKARLQVHNAGQTPVHWVALKKTSGHVKLSQGGIRELKIDNDLAKSVALLPGKSLHIPVTLRAIRGPDTHLLPDNLEVILKAKGAIVYQDQFGFLHTTRFRSMDDPVRVSKGETEFRLITLSFDKAKDHASLRP